MDLHCAGTTAHHWFKSYSDMIIVLRLLICCELFSYLLYIVAELLWAFLNRLTCEYSAEWKHFQQVKTFGVRILHLVYDEKRAQSNFRMKRRLNSDSIFFEPRT